MPKLCDYLRLYLITDGRLRSPDELGVLVDQALRGGVTSVQLREKSATRAQIFQYLSTLKPLCDAHGALLFLNAGSWFPDLSPEMLHGVHLQSSTWSPAQPTELTQWLEKNAGLHTIYSAHSVDEAKSVFERGIPAVTLSPIYPTPSKQGILAPLGPSTIAQARRECPGATIVALGGINLATAAEIIRYGADGIAMIRAILEAPNVELAARSLRSLVDSALNEQRNFST
jgi:thiamine-phosphate pyrophosphorylase